VRLAFARSGLTLLAALTAVLGGLAPSASAQSFVPESWKTPVQTGEFTALGVTRCLEAIRVVDTIEVALLLRQRGTEVRGNLRAKTTFDVANAVPFATTGGAQTNFFDATDPAYLATTLNPSMRRMVSPNTGIPAPPEQSDHEQGNHNASPQVIPNAARVSLFAGWGDRRWATAWLTIENCLPSNGTITPFAPFRLISLKYLCFTGILLSCQSKKLWRPPD